MNKSSNERNSPGQWDPFVAYRCSHTMLPVVKTPPARWNEKRHCYVSRNSNEFYDGDISRLLALPASYEDGETARRTNPLFPRQKRPHPFHYKSHNENLTNPRRATKREREREMNSLSPPVLPGLIPLFTFACRTREGVQLRDAVLQDAVPGQ